MHPVWSLPTARSGTVPSREQEMTQPRTLTRLQLRFKPHETRSLVLTPRHTVKQDFAATGFLILLQTHSLSSPVCSRHTFLSQGQKAGCWRSRISLPSGPLSSSRLSLGVPVRFSSASPLLWGFAGSGSQGDWPRTLCQMERWA